MPLTALIAHLVLAQAAPAPPQIPDGLTYEANVTYSSARDNLAMDIVRPKNAQAPSPAILLVHGGGFRAGRRQSMLPFAIELAKHGYAAATASYGLAPKHPFPAAVHDVKAAVRFLRANASKYGIDPARIGATGSSAGGHLVLMLGLTGSIPELEGTGGNGEQSSRVQAVVNYYGPTDLSKSCGKSVDACEVLPPFLGGDVNTARANYIEASPLNYVTPFAAPILTLHGTVDRYVNIEHAIWLHDRLIQAGVPNELVTLGGADHGFKGDDLKQAQQRTIAWFDKYLKGTPP